jgi:hypothetical protein
MISCDHVEPIWFLNSIPNIFGNFVDELGCIYRWLKNHFILNVKLFLKSILVDIPVVCAHAEF